MSHKGFFIKDIKSFLFICILLWYGGVLERVIHDLRLKPEQIAEYTKLLDEDPKGLEFVYKFDVDYEKTIRPALKKRGAEEIGGQKRYTFNYEMIFMAGFRKAWGDYTRAMEKISKMP